MIESKNLIIKEVGVVFSFARNFSGLLYFMTG